MTDMRASARRKLLVAACAAVGIGVSLGACATATFPFIPDHYTFSKEQVQQALGRKFPYQRTVSQVFNVSLSHPMVDLLPGTNRVSVRLDAHFESPLLQRPVSGVFTLSSQLAYDSASRAIVLKEPTVDDVSLDGEARAYAQQVNATAALFATQWLANYPIYTFKPEQLQFGGVSYEPGTITILTNGIRVQILEK
jgi:hypothetical protein